MLRARLHAALFIVGALMLGFYIAARLQGRLLSAAELARFQQVRTNNVATHQQTDALPDFALWSAKRIADYRKGFAIDLGAPIGILRVPRVHIEAPVLEGTDELTLNRGVGLIAGTALPGEDGNVGIAGHRDGFFRGLKDVVVGDRIEIVSTGHTDTYSVDRIVIVAPNDLSVLAPRPHSVTLVTCYPFYFIGSAPQRFIVQASRTDTDYTHPATAMR